MESERLSRDRQEMDMRGRELALLIGLWFTGQVMVLSQVGRRKGYQEGVGPWENGDMEGPVSQCWWTSKCCKSKAKHAEGH